MPFRFSEPIPDALDRGTWTQKLGAGIKRWMMSMEEAMGGLQGTPDVPSQIRAGEAADANDSQAAAPSNHIHDILTATPSVPVGDTFSPGTDAALMRADAGLRLGIVSAEGETIGHDGTDPVALPAPTMQRGGAFVAPTAPLDVVIWRAPWPCKVTAVKGEMEGGTSADVNARKNGTDEHLAADLSLTPGAWTDGGAVQNVDYVAGDSLEIRLKAVVGSPTAVTVQVEFNRLPT